MTETFLRVPIVEAVEWGDWLVEQLALASEKADVEMIEPDGEEEGDWFVFTFGDRPEAVEQVARDALAAKKVSVAVTGADEVTVSVAQTSTWIRILGPAEHAYDRAMKDAAQKFSESRREWWAKTGKSKLLIQQSHADGRHPWVFEEEGDDLLVIARLDLTILDRKASKAEVEETARAHLTTVIEQVSGHLGLEAT